MDNSETQKQVIKLGKLFVEELKLEPGSDTLSKWMAYYLAEKIKKAETSEMPEKEGVEKECFEIILKLWKHRWTVPHGRRPLENFEPILNFLQKLDPDKDDPYFFALIPDNYRDGVRAKTKEGSPEYWIQIAEQIDRSARILLDAVLKLAGEAASNEKTAEWLQNSVKLPNNHDTQILRVLIDDDTLDDDGNITDKGFEKKYNTAQLNSRIEHLQQFVKLSEFLIEKYQNDLAKIR